MLIVVLSRGCCCHTSSEEDEIDDEVIRMIERAAFGGSSGNPAALYLDEFYNRIAVHQYTEVGAPSESEAKGSVLMTIPACTMDEISGVDVSWLCRRHKFVSGDDAADPHNTDSPNIDDEYDMF